MLRRKSLSTQQGSDTGTDEELEIPERAVMDQRVLRIRVAADGEEKTFSGPRQRPGLAADLSLVRLQGPLFTCLSKNKALAEQWMGPSTPGQQKADVPSQGNGQPTRWRQAMDSSLGFKGWTPGAEEVHLGDGYKRQKGASRDHSLWQGQMVSPQPRFLMDHRNSIKTCSVISHLKKPTIVLWSHLSH